MTRFLVAICALIGLALAQPATAQDDLAVFARDIDRAESLRTVMTLQRTYAQMAQYGLWNDVGALFARDGHFLFDGLVKPVQTMKGSAAIAEFLRKRYGGGHEGLRRGDVSTMMIEAPVANLSADGASANVRWEAMIYHGHGGEARERRHVRK